MSETNDPPNGDLRIAGAPVSYGAFEITVGRDVWVPDPVEVLRHVASIGCEGIELGPVGYLGPVGELGRRLAEANLSLAGGYVQIPFSETLVPDGALAELRAVLDAFDQAPRNGLPPKPVLADRGSPAREANPGRAATDRSLGLDAEQWKQFLEGLEMVWSMCTDRGYEATFHPHAGTYVESGWEIERLLEDSTVGVCYDTGHLTIGGSDPLAAIRSWGQRINHIHIKDTRLDVVRRYMDERVPAETYYAGEPFAPFGEGDVDIAAVLAEIRKLGFRQWLVIEQDVVLRSPSQFQKTLEDQQHNRAYLRDIGI